MRVWWQAATMPPVARKFIQYDAGSPEEALQAAITARYGGNNEPFFKDVATRLRIRPDSVSGAFYKAMRRVAGLPDSHKAAYTALLEISLETLNEIGREAVLRAPADPLAALRAEVAALTEALAVASDEHEKLAGRVAELEKARRARRAPAESPPPRRASARARSAQ